MKEETTGGENAPTISDRDHEEPAHVGALLVAHGLDG
jgi:hypothetical protein